MRDFSHAAGDIADWGGIPLNDAARLYALSWPASRQTVKQQQCMGYVHSLHLDVARQSPHLGRARSVYAAARWRFILGADRSSRPDRYTWTDVRIRRPMRRTPSRDSRRGNSTATSLTHHDNAHQTRLDQSERRSSKRRRDSDGTSTFDTATSSPSWLSSTIRSI